MCQKHLEGIGIMAYPFFVVVLFYPIPHVLTHKIPARGG